MIEVIDLVVVVRVSIPYVDKPSTKTHGQRRAEG
jgi:hypothetical protein